MERATWTRSETLGQRWAAPHGGDSRTFSAPRAPKKKRLRLVLWVTRECTPYTNGTYADENGTVSCDPAEAGSFVATRGASNDTLCEPGYYSPGQGALACIKCPVGSFSSGYGAIICTSADLGSFFYSCNPHYRFSCRTADTDVIA